MAVREVEFSPDGSRFVTVEGRGYVDTDPFVPAAGKVWVWNATDGKAIVVTDVGQHQMWEAQYYKHDAPRTLITSGGLGTMGFALPAAIGAKIERYYLRFSRLFSRA